MHKDATHIVYAYRTADNQYRYNDANEPKNSAGKPLYNVIEKNELYNVLIAVIRYFGGIKLGIGGLVRAYTHTASELIRNVPVKTLELGLLIDLSVSYANHDELMYKLRNTDGITVMKENFMENIVIRAAIRENMLDFVEKLPWIDRTQVIDKLYLAF